MVGENPAAEGPMIRPEDLECSENLLLGMRLVEPATLPLEAAPTSVLKAERTVRQERIYRDESILDDIKHALQVRRANSQG